MKLKVKKLRTDAVLPTRAHVGDAGLDLVAHRIYVIGHRIKVNFGIAVEIPEGHVGLICPRSSIYKRKTRLANSVGVIDSGYRGELSAVFDVEYYKDGGIYAVGERCAQLVILPLPSVEVEEVDDLSTSERGTRGYGSSGQGGVK